MSYKTNKNLFKMESFTKQRFGFQPANGLYSSQLRL